VEAVHQCLPNADWQRCILHFHRNILAKVPRERGGEVAPLLKAIQGQESKETAKEKAERVITKLVDICLLSAAQTLKDHTAAERAKLFDCLLHDIFRRGS
jgi:transposase-like protein